MSIANRLLPIGFHVSGRTRQWRSREALLRAVARRDPWPASPPRLRRVSVRTERADPWPVVRLVPAGARGTYLHLHGGGYVFGPVAQQWSLLERLALATRREVLVPLYRLAPGGIAEESVPVAADLIRTAGDEAIAGGDSAGGGLALAAAAALAREGRRIPLVLVSPWVDAVLDDPATAAADARDPWLGAPGLRAAADLWRGGLDVRDPRVSPLRGDLAGLGPVLVVTGTRDVLHPQALALASALDAAGTEVRLEVGRGLFHNWPFLPVPEARPGRRAMAEALRRP